MPGKTSSLARQALNNYSAVNSCTASLILGPAGSEKQGHGSMVPGWDWLACRAAKH